MRVALPIVLAFGAAVAAQQPPRFRGGVELVQLDVSVLDRDRRPVRGLTADDFTILEDRKAQPIVAFEELSAPDPDGALVPWMRDVAPDVRTNSADGRRIFALVMDDVSITGGPDELRIVDTAKKIARAFIERMGPLDQACVVFTGDNRLAQDFTSDRRALLAVVERFHGTAVPPFLRGLYPSSVVGRVAESLMEVSHRRKAMVYIGSGIRIAADLEFTQVGTPMGQTASQSQQNAEAEGAIRYAQRSNVSIYTINPRGLESFSADQEDARVESNVVNDSLETLANATGGFAIVNSNGFAGKVSQIFTETGSYYLLGFRSAYTDGRFRRINVKVNRPGAVVRTRSGYVAPKADKPGKETPPLFKALAGVLPNPDLYMRAAVAPFAAPDGKTGNVAIVLGLSQPAPEAGRASHVIDIVASAFTREGKPVTQRRQTARLTMHAAEGGLAQFEIFTRLDLKPGLYNLRFAIHDASAGKSGSVYTEVAVPNFSKEHLSLSGLVLNVAPALPSAGGDVLAGIVAAAPTTQRVFARGDRAVALLRVYQGGGKPAAPVSMRTVVRDAADAAVFDATTRLDAAAFAASRSAEFSVPLLAATLPPGSYLLTVDAAVDEKTHASRDVRFSIR